MKNIFDYNHTSEIHDGSIFYARKISDELEQKSNETFEEFFEMEEQSQPAGIVKLLEIICMIVVVGGGAGIVNAIGKHDVGVFEAVKNAPCFFVLIIIAAVAWAIIHFKMRRSEAAFVQQVEEHGLLDEMNDLSSLAAAELDLPDDRFEMEAYCHHYEMKDGKKKLNSKEFCDINLMDVYEKDMCLCFFDGVREFAVPYAEIKTIDVDDKNLRIMEWLKEDDYKDKKYKQYKIRETNVGLVITQHYQICIDHEGEQYEIIVPNYEEEAMRKIVELVKPHKQ